MRAPSRTSTSARPKALEVQTVSAAPAPPPRPALPWWLAAAGGAVVAGVGVWVIVAAAFVWAAVAATGELGSATLLTATWFWLLAHGGPMELGGVTVTLIPLCLTLVAAVLLHGVGAYAAKQALLARPDDPPSRLAAKAGGLATAAYALAVTVVASLTSPSLEGAWAGVGALVLGLLAAGSGARSAVGWRPWGAWPPWARALPRAVASAVAVMLTGGAAAVIAGLIAHRGLVASLFQQYDAGLAGTILFALLQAAFLGNAVVWAAAWTTGAGFSLGGTSVVVLVGRHIDAVPTLPLIGALPASSPAPWTNLLWLLVGVTAGAVAAVTVVRARPRARFDETALVGGAAGIVSGLVFAACSLLSRGDIGSDRLTGLGPLPLGTAVLSVTVMGFAGVFAGLILGLLRTPPREPVGATEEVARTVTLWAPADAAGPGDDSEPPATGVPATTPPPHVGDGPPRVVGTPPRPVGDSQPPRVAVTAATAPLHMHASPPPPAGVATPPRPVGDGQPPRVGVPAATPPRPVDDGQPPRVGVPAATPSRPVDDGPPPPARVATPPRHTGDSSQRADVATPPRPVDTGPPPPVAVPPAPVHFGPHNVASVEPPPDRLTDALADPGPQDADSGSLDFTVAMTSPFHELNGGQIKRPNPGDEQLPLDFSTP